MNDNYIQASICYDCQELIVLRQLGNIWKLPYMPSHKDKKQHKPTIIFSTLWDARKVKKEANTQFWDSKELNEDCSKNYNKNRLLSIEIACEILGYVKK